MKTFIIGVVASRSKYNSYACSGPGLWSLSQGDGIIFPMQALILCQPSALFLFGLEAALSLPCAAWLVLAMAGWPLTAPQQSYNLISSVSCSSLMKRAGIRPGLALR